MSSNLSTYYRIIAQELENDGQTVFIHNEKFFHVYRNSSNEYEYDMYQNLNEEPIDGGINESYSAQQTISCLLDEN